jgi:hypothetical protein
MLVPRIISRNAHQKFAEILPRKRPIRARGAFSSLSFPKIPSGDKYGKIAATND